MRLILASASPRRRRLIGLLTDDFVAVTCDAEELTEGEPRRIAEENSRRKALAASRLYRGTVLGAEPTLWMDTEDGRVFLDREIVAQTADMALIYLYRGEQIVREWDFYVGEEALPGSYSLTLTFRGEEVVIPDFITVF